MTATVELTLTYAGGTVVSNQFQIAGSVVQPLTPDVTAPTVPVLFTGSLVANKPVLQWLSSSDPSIAGAVWSGMKDYQIYRSINGGAVTLIGTVNAPTLGLNLAMTAADIGVPAVSGSTTQTGSTLTISGGGLDFGGSSDQGQFCGTQITGDWICSFEVTALSGPQEFSSAGVNVRLSTAANVPNVTAKICPPTGGGGKIFDYRATIGGATTDASSALGVYTLPVYATLQSVGGVYTMSYGASQSGLSAFAPVTNAIGSTVLLGAYATAHQVTGTTSATIANFNVTQDGMLSFTDNSTSPGTSAQTCVYTIIARDQALNQSSASSSVTVIIPAIGASAGVQVGPNGKLVSTLDGSNVVLVSEHVNGMQFGPITFSATSAFWKGYQAMTSAQYAAATAKWANTLPAGVARQKGTITNLRLGVGSAPLMAYTGISWDGGTACANQYRALGVNDNNGRPLYCASLTGGSKGTTPGTEVAGDPTAYRGYVDTVVQNFLGATAIDGIFRTATIVIEFGAPQLTSTGQILMCTDQPATLCVPDLAALAYLSQKYGGNKSIILELYNELFGTNIISNAENAWLSQANGSGVFNPSPAPFAFPTATTSPSGTNGGYRTGIGGGLALGGGQTCNAVCWQQALDTCRSNGATNVLIVGCTVASSALSTWSYNGGTQLVVDSYTVNGIKQMAAAYHAYNKFQTTAQADAIVAAGVPFICTEGGSITAVGGNANASPGFSYARYWSHYSGYCWSSMSNFYSPPLANYYTDGGGFSFGQTFAWNNQVPWYCSNVPHLGSGANNDGSDHTQVPTASN